MMFYSAHIKHTQRSLCAQDTLHFLALPAHHKPARFMTIMHAGALQLFPYSMQVPL